MVDRWLILWVIQKSLSYKAMNTVFFLTYLYFSITFFSQPAV